MTSGWAFIAEPTNGTTALVLRGAGEVRFAPAVRHRAGTAASALLRARPCSRHVDRLRLHPDQPERVFQSCRSPTTCCRPVAGRSGRRGPRELRTSALHRPARSYNLDLRDLSRDHWSLEPGFGSVVVEFRARRFGWLTYARSPSESEDVSLFDRERRRNIAIYASKEKLAERGEFYSETSRSSYEWSTTRIDRKMDPSRSGRRTHAPSGCDSRGPRVDHPEARRAVRDLVDRVCRSGRLLNLRVLGQNSDDRQPATRRRARARRIMLDVEYSGRLDPQALNRETIAVAADQGRRPVRDRCPDARAAYRLQQQRGLVSAGAWRRTTPRRRYG